MIATTASRHYVMLHFHTYQIGKLRYELFVWRLEGMQSQFEPIVDAFDALGQQHGIDFDDLWKEAAQVIVDDSRFVLFSGPEVFMQLDREWNAWLARLEKRIDDKRSLAHPGIDSRLQIEALRKFITMQLEHRRYIARLSTRLWNRLFVDVPQRLRIGDIGAACRVSANVLNSVTSAVSSSFSVINTMR